jgi:hypothetical protein
VALIRAVLGDAGPLYALLDLRDQYFAQARSDAEALERARVDVMVLVTTLTEAFALALYRLGPRVAHS